jgi:2-dehydro-3-deoxyphosphogluconate aldolase/(4S)-4-hydroxy-2-oxoglutarate aldolase
MDTGHAKDALALLRREIVVACVRADDAGLAREAAFAALRGGVRVLEVTLTTPGALDTIAALAREADAIPGAGTVLDPEDVRRVEEAGGRFGMSPIVDPAVIARAAERGLLFTPGAATPTEVMAARRAGAHVVKIFPIGPLGGVAFLRAIRGPLPGIPFLPTNGVKVEETAEYLRAGAVALGFGREVFPPEALARRDLGAVEEAARKLVAAVRAQAPPTPALPPAGGGRSS